MRVSIKILSIILCCALSHSSIGQSIRKPWREMTAGERDAYVTAINSLPGSIPQTLSSEHNRLAMLFGMQNQHIHNSNIFLPWHRVFLIYFEEQLKAIDPDISVPYWDWTEDWSSSADIFEDASGGNTGLFGFDVTGSVWEDPSTGTKYIREFDSSEPQPTTTGLNNIVNTSDFTQHRAALELGPHNTGHRFVGEGNGIPPWGTMATMFSPADPIFYLHHLLSRPLSFITHQL